MELLKKAREELRKMRDRFLDLVDPNSLHLKVEEVVHHAVDELEKLHAVVANLEQRMKLIEHAAEVRVHEALVRAGLAKPEDAPLPPTDPAPPSDESAAPGGAPADPPATSVAPAGSEAVADAAPPAVISIPLSPELVENIAAAEGGPAV